IPYKKVDMDIDDMGGLTSTAVRGRIAIVGAAIFQSLRRFDWLMPQAKSAQFPQPVTSDPKALHCYRPLEYHQREMSLSQSRSSRALPTSPVRLAIIDIDDGCGVTGCLRLAQGSHSIETPVNFHSATFGRSSNGRGRDDCLPVCALCWNWNTASGPRRRSTTETSNELASIEYLPCGHPTSRRVEHFAEQDSAKRRAESL